MHLAIASLGMGVPVGCITYQGKFQGLIEGFFDLYDVCIKPEDVFCSSDRFVEFVEKMFFD